MSAMTVIGSVAGLLVIGGEFLVLYPFAGPDFINGDSIWAVTEMENMHALEIVVAAEIGWRVEPVLAECCKARFRQSRCSARRAA